MKKTILDLKDFLKMNSENLSSEHCLFIFMSIKLENTDFSGRVKSESFRYFSSHQEDLIPVNRDGCY